MSKLITIFLVITPWVFTLGQDRVYELMRERLDNLRRQSLEAQSKISDLDTKLTSLREQNRKLKSRNQSLSKKLRENEAELANTLKQMNDARALLEMKILEIAFIQQQVEHLKGDTLRLVTQLNQLSTLRKQLEDELTNTKNILSQARKENEEISKKAVLRSVEANLNRPFGKWPGQRRIYLIEGGFNLIGGFGMSGARLWQVGPSANHLAGITVGYDFYKDPESNRQNYAFCPIMLSFRPDMNQWRHKWLRPDSTYNYANTYLLLQAGYAVNVNSQNSDFNELKNGLVFEVGCGGVLLSRRGSSDLHVSLALRGQQVVYSGSSTLWETTIFIKVGTLLSSRMR